MTCNGRDLTIEAALADPVIGAVMRADRVDPQRFEALLRTTARRLESARRASAAPCAATIHQVRRATCMALPSW